MPPWGAETQLWALELEPTESGADTRMCVGAALHIVQRILQNQDCLLGRPGQPQKLLGTLCISMTDVTGPCKPM